MSARLVASLALALALVPIATAAHAFLAASSPEASERVAAAPRTLELRFTEPVVPQSVHVSIKAPSGAPLDLKGRTFADGDTTVRMGLPQLAHGIYLVDWHVTSGGDGHLSGGEFAFAIGAGGTIPTGAQQQEGVSWPQTIARFLAIVGIALAAGAVFVQMLFSDRSRSGDLSFENTLAFFRIMLILALVATLGEFLLFAEGLSPGGNSLTFGALTSALRTSVGFSDAISAGAIFYALIASVTARSPVAAVAALPLALLATALQTHPAATNVVWKQVVISFHVLLGTFWAGALGHLAYHVFTDTKESKRGKLLRALRRYSSLAIWAVSITIATGIVSALTVIPNLTQLVMSGYGRILLVKSGLVAVAMAYAFLGRRILTPSNSADGLGKLRTLMPVESICALAILAAASLLGNAAPPAIAAPAAALLGVARPKGPTLTIGSRVGWLEAFVTASAKDLTLTVTGPGDVPPDDLRLATKDAAGNAIFVTPPQPPARSSAIGLVPRPCGPGCFTVPYQWRVGETHVRVKLESQEWDGGGASFTVVWPPAPVDPTIVRRMISAMRAQKFVRVDEVESTAPNAYARDSHRLSGSQIVSALPYNEFTLNVRPFPKTGDGFVLYLPGSHQWARAWLDRKSRLLRQLTLNPSLEVDDRFSYSDTPIEGQGS